MIDYILSPSAQDDLTDIADYYLKEGGTRVARKMLVEFVTAFRFLAKTPGAGHTRQDLTDNQSVRFWPMRDYLILYRVRASKVEIITVVRGTKDVPSLLRRRAI